VSALSSTITIVSGLPRSGTSLMMQILAAGGISPLTDNQRAADESNPRGYFEFEPVKRLRADRSWIEQAQGRAIKVIHLLLRELPTDGQFDYRVILMHRSMAEVLASQRAMLERQNKVTADDAILAKVYQSQLDQAEQWLTSQPAFSVLVMDHHAVLKTPELAANAINDFLGGELDVAAMIRAVDPALYRERR
jgi:Sulfotransferase domain